MGYLGLTPTTAQQNYLNIDDISGSFNGTTTSFALQVGSVAPTPFPVTNSCLISVGGVIQEPDDTGTSGFRISGGNIVFSSAPGTGEDFFGLVLAGADYLNVGANFPDGTVGTPSITFDSDTNTGIYHPSADELSFVTGGSDRVRVDSNGRLGIGTSSPGNYGTNADDLVISGAGNSGLTIASGTSSAGALHFADGTTGDQAYRGIIKYEHGNDRFLFGTAGGTTAITIDSSQRLLVGTTTGTESVHVNGAIASVGTSSSFSGGAKRAFFDYNGGANRARIGVTSGADNAAQAISFHTSPSGAAPGSFERFRIGEVGQLGIGGATYGTSGQVLTSQGSSAAPQWASVSAGYTSLGRTNTTSGSSHTVTGIPTTARHVVIIFSNMSFTNTSTPHLSLQVGNGSLGNSDYYWSIGYGNSSQMANAASSARIFHTDFSAAANSYAGIIEIYPRDPYVQGHMQMYAISSSQSQQPNLGTFRWANGSTIDRVNLSSASTFDAGHFVVYYI